MSDSGRTLEAELSWIRKKLGLPNDAPMFGGDGPTIAGTLHVVCSHAHGYETYIAAYKCNDKQGEIARLTVERDRLVDAIHEANRKVNAAQTLNSNQRQMVDQAEIEKGALQIRIDNAVAELDNIADLLADSEDLPVGQTAAMRLLNETLEALAGVPRNKESGYE